MLETTSDRSLNVDEAVRQRYSEGARERQEALCCPVSYDQQYLEAIPREVIEKDYGCGDPSKHLKPGDTVLDLGSGTGKICFIASQVVGAEGRVIGVDMNDDMLEVARRNAPVVAEKTGHSNVEFRKGRIQDLQLDRGLLESWLGENPIRSGEDYVRLEAHLAELRSKRPLIEDESVDAVVSNCVLNLVEPADKAQLFGEIFRVLKRGGRAVISDIVSDEDVPQHLQDDPELWSGCVSGSFREDAFLEAFEKAGFHGITVLERQQEPWTVVEGIEFRSVTVAAWKGKQGPCLDQGHAVMYRGPFSRVEDDDGHAYPRGVRVAVCEKTHRLFAQEPYREHVDLVAPRELVPLEEAPDFPCTDGVLVRHPRETKGEAYRETKAPAEDCCGPAAEPSKDSGSGCC